MQLMLRDVAPFNLPPVDNAQAAAFMSRLTGTEAFAWEASRRPRSVLVHSLKYAYPRHSFATGFLLSCDIDTFQAACLVSETMPPILQRYVVGKLHIEYGGTLESVVIIASPITYRP
jgi:hypothetical protein